MNTQITKQNIDQIFHPGFITDMDKFVEFINTNRDLTPNSYSYSKDVDGDDGWDWMEGVDTTLEQNKHQFMYMQCEKLLFPNNGTQDPDDYDDVYDTTVMDRREAILGAADFISEDFQNHYCLHYKDFHSQYLNYDCSFGKYHVFKGVDDQFYIQKGCLKDATIKTVSQQQIVDLFNHHLNNS